MRSFFALWPIMALLLVLLSPAVSGTLVHICNQYVDEVHLSWDTNGADMRKPLHTVLLYDQCVDEELTPGWGGAFFAGQANNSHHLGAWRDADTKVEFFIDPTGGVNWFDVSHVNGFSLPTTVSGNDIEGGCAVDKLVGCPVEWQGREWEGGPVLQCRNDHSDAATKYFAYECPNTYVRYNDDASGTKATAYPAQLDVSIRAA